MMFKAGDTLMYGDLGQCKYLGWTFQGCLAVRFEDSDETRYISPTFAKKVISPEHVCLCCGKATHPEEMFCSRCTSSEGFEVRNG